MSVSDVGANQDGQELHESYLRVIEHLRSRRASEAAILNDLKLAERKLLAGSKISSERLREWIDVHNAQVAQQKIVSRLSTATTVLQAEAAKLFSQNVRRDLD